jgi:hypothetical protein
MFVVIVAIVFSLDLTISVATVTTNIRQYYATDLQTDGILVLAQDEGDTTREI